MLVLILLLVLVGCGEPTDPEEAACLRRARQEAERRVDGPLVEQELRAKCRTRR